MRLLAFLLLIGFLLFGVAARHYYVCELKGLCDDRPTAAENSERRRNLQLRDGDQILLDGYEQFAFDSAGVSPRLTPDNERFLDTLAGILLQDTSRDLTITGFYRPSEEGQESGFFENLGLARADAIRRLLSERGVAESRITLDHGISDQAGLPEPLTFALYGNGAAGDFEKLAFTFTNMTFSQDNFKFDSDVFDPGEPFLLYADSVLTYLEQNPEKSLTIVGHADYTGTEQYNYDLGLRRAQSAKTFFEQRGVAAPIEVRSAGETQPVAPNNDPRGREKNRRVNFILE